MTGHASARTLVADALAAFLPPARASVAEFAAEHRYLANEGGGYVGRWDHAIAPYLVEPMEALTSLDFRTVVVPGPGRCGKTQIGENWLLWSVASSPAAMLWYLHTNPAVEAYVKNAINPMIDAHEPMRQRQGLRPVDDSLHFKRFTGMTVEFLAMGLSTLINKGAPRILADEYDAIDESLGDVKNRLDLRRQTYGDESKLLALSHPDRARGREIAGWTAGIMALYADSDRRVWYWPCPHCGARSSPAPIAARVMTLEFSREGSLEDAERTAHLLCPVNGCRIEDAERPAMNAAGVWIADGQTISEDGTIEGTPLRRNRTAGFWIQGVMSPFVMGGLGGLARALLKAERAVELEATAEAERALAEVWSKQLGIPYAPARRIGMLDAAVIAERAAAEPGRRGEVAPGVRFLTLAVDCQAAHFEWLLRGFGIGGESWIVDTGRVPGDPATSAEDWDALFAAVLARIWPIGGTPGRAMRPRAIGWDSHGAAGTTAQAYAAFTRWQRRGEDPRPRKLGQIGGRDVWTMLPMRGANSANPPRLIVTYPDTARAANRKAARGQVPVAQFGPNLFKDDLAGQLGRADPGPGHVHFPAWLRATDPAGPHPFFEQLTAETRDAQGRWSRPHTGRRNEALDLMVMTHALAHLHGLARIDWNRAPAWAAPWDENSMIVSLTPGGAAQSPASHDASGIPGQSPAELPAAATKPRGIGRLMAQRFNA